MLNKFCWFYRFFKEKVSTVYGKTVLTLHGVCFGKRLQIRGKLYIENDGKVCIGNNCRFNSGIWANATDGSCKTSFRVMGGELIIGNNCGISNTAFACTTQIIVDDDVLIGSGCCVWDTDFHSLKYKERILGEQGKSAPIQIGKGAFIGARSIILKGVTIGRFAVVGAGSVVTCDVPDGEMWGGNPAKFIRRV